MEKWVDPPRSGWETLQGNLHPPWARNRSRGPRLGLVSNTGLQPCRESTGHRREVVWDQSDCEPRDAKNPGWRWADRTLGASTLVGRASALNPDQR